MKFYRVYVYRRPFCGNSVISMTEFTCDSLREVKKEIAKMREHWGDLRSVIIDKVERRIIGEKEIRKG